MIQYVKQYAAGTGQDIHALNNGCLYLNGGASKDRETNSITLAWFTWTAADSSSFAKQWIQGASRRRES